MANTYTQIHIQLVFAVKYRKALIEKQWNEILHKYITGIVQNHSHKMIAINSMPDHIHLLFGFRPTQALSDLVRMIKSDSSEWINNQPFTGTKFQWQPGYGAFSYCHSQIHDVANYIEQQEAHHAKKSFREEYETLLKDFEIDYDARFMFTDPE